MTSRDCDAKSISEGGDTCGISEKSLQSGVAPGLAVAVGSQIRYDKAHAAIRGLSRRSRRE
jgi:hypothetical protein